MLAYVLAALAGLALGSFLNVVITRLPRREGFVGGRSRCPECRRRLAWYDTIPLLSYLFRRGLCRWCGAAIPRRYPLVELAGALSGLALWAAFPYSPLLLAYVPFVMALLALSVIDLEQGLLPDAITLPGIALGLILAAFLPGLDFFEALTGAVTGGILFQAVAWGYKKWSGRPGLGGGDIKLMAMIGAFLGFESLPWVILGSATLGTLAGAALVLAKGEWQGGKWRTLQMPFGPFLAAGALVYLWGGEYLLRFGEAGGLG